VTFIQEKKRARRPKEGASPVSLSSTPTPPSADVRVSLPVSCGARVTSVRQGTPVLDPTLMDTDSPRSISETPVSTASTSSFGEHADAGGIAWMAKQSALAECVGAFVSSLSTS
jgi:hypothetical protein